MSPAQTAAQRAAAESAAGLSAAQSAGVNAGKGYTPSNPSLSYYTPTPPAASLPAASSGNNAATTAPVLPSAPNPSQTPEISPQAPQPIQTPQTPIAPPSGSVGANPTLPSLDTVKAAIGTLGTTPAQMETGSLQYQDQAVQASQDIIDAIERSFNTEISTAAGNAAASAAASGMAGSPQAGSEVAAAMEPGLSARAGAVATAMENIRSLAASQYATFQQMGVSNAKDTLTQFQAAQQQVVSAATSVWAAGYTPSELQASNPDEYQYLLEYGYNGDANAMNAAYVAAAQKNLMNNGQPVYQAGNSMVFGQYNGINADGTPNFKFIPVTLPGNVPLGYKMQSNNQTTNGQVITTFAPVDSNGNIIYDPSKPNGGIVTQINGQTIGQGTDGSATINPILSGQTIGNTTLGTVPNGVSENAAVTGQGIIDGTSPPTISNSMSGVGTQVKSYLAANGFDLSKAALDWQAVSKYMATLNSATQVRFRQAVMSVPPMLDNAQSQFDKLQTDIQGTATLPQGLTVLNSTNLAAFASGAYGPQLQSDAINLQNQITDVTSEVGTVFKGGNTATDLALQNGASMLSGSWDPQTFKDAINLIKQNMMYRKSAVLNAGVAGTTGDNQYAPDVSGGQTDSSSQDNSSSTPTMYPAGTIVSDAQGNEYTVGADGETLTPYTPQ